LVRVESTVGEGLVIILSLTIDLFVGKPDIGDDVIITTPAIDVEIEVFS